ncbi:MAG: hypothetical protein SchgKO_20080 [Schleiferiaceae bacterium]
MKKTITVFALALSTLAFGQTRLDSTEVGASNDMDVYYSLENGTVSTVARDTWHVAFSTSSLSASVMINSAGSSAGALDLFVASDDTADWATLDTAGMYQVYNDPTDWEFGAFSNLGTFHPDYGWGTYNQTTHDVNAKRIFVIKMPNDTYKKMMIMSMKASGMFEFKYADLDGSNEVTDSFNKSTYGTKNFIYYNLSTGMFVDREPAKTDWDMLFTKYLDEVAPMVYYPVTGVLINANAMNEQVSMVDTATAQWSVLNTEINTIGYDWKTFDMGTFTYIIDDSTAYFVQNNAGDVYKVCFRSYGGGKSVFAVTLSSMISVDEFETITAKAYPNPTTDFITVDLGSLETADYRVVSLSGQLVAEGNIANGERISMADQQPGMYLVQLTSGNRISTLRIIVQ